MKKAYFNWSSGKDASLALFRLKQEGAIQIDRLVITVNAHHDRVSMHGLRRELLNQQAEAIGIPLDTIELPENPSMEEYGELMKKKVDELKAQGYADCAFGDIFLEDLREYREKQLEGIHCHFPLWKEDTRELLQEFIELGFKAVIICASDKLLGESYVGQEIDQNFLDHLPENVDPCGENGEFHTFCYDGPIFSKPVTFSKGEKILRTYPDPEEKGKEVGFWFIDLMPD
mgnify:CR=1 FL=1